MLWRVASQCAALQHGPQASIPFLHACLHLCPPSILLAPRCWLRRTSLCSTSSTAVSSVLMLQEASARSCYLAALACLLSHLLPRQALCASQAEPCSSVSTCNTQPCAPFPCVAVDVMATHVLHSTITHVGLQPHRQHSLTQPRQKALSVRAVPV